MTLRFDAFRALNLSAELEEGPILGAEPSAKARRARS
jgi:hypothetical protein